MYFLQEKVYALDKFDYAYIVSPVSQEIHKECVVQNHTSLV